MPRNNSRDRKDERRIKALRRSPHPIEQLIGFVAEKKFEEARENEEHLMRTTHFAGHEAGCSMTPAVCQAAHGRSNRTKNS